MANETKKTTTWPELAIGLFEKLDERDARIDYVFEDLSVAVPSHAGADASHATWTLNGTLKISTSSKK
ncbi:MAG TPA: hypothetical protein VJ952_11080 [Opitutales bacterium]|nr:hypothetical protein [Opitutales bacterium]